MNLNDFIKQHYGKIPTAELSGKTGLSVNAVQKRAARMGLFFSK